MSATASASSRTSPPIAGGVPRPAGFTDTQRLLAGELVYTGVRRTPIFALAPALPYRGAACPAIPELFATAADAYVTLGDLPEDPLDHRTADGRELTRARARDRLARVIGADRETFSDADARAAAAAFESRQLEALRAGLGALAQKMGTPPAAAVLAGEGEFLLQRALRPLWPRCRIISLADRLGPEASRAACAAALLDRLEELLR